MAATTHAAESKTTPPSAPRPKRRSSRTGRPPCYFSFFPNLPAEIRLAIWRCTFPGPRVVVLRPRQTTVFPRTPGAAPQYAAWYTSPARLPAALHACREARAECRAAYPVLFGPPAPRPPGADERDERNADPAAAAALGGVFFSPARDVLYLGGGGAAARLRIQGFLGAAATADDLARVRRVAIAAAALWDERPGPALAAASAAACLAALHAAMPALDHLAVVRRDPDPLYSADAALMALRCVDHVLLRNVHKALGLLRDDTAAATTAMSFPAWEIMDMAVPPQSPPQYPRPPPSADAATGTVPSPSEEEEEEEEDGDEGPWTSVKLHPAAEPWAGHAGLVM